MTCKACGFTALQNAERRELLLVRLDNGETARCGGAVLNETSSGKPLAHSPKQPAPDKLPLTGHYGLGLLIGEAITSDVETYELGSDEHYTTLLVDWQGEQYALTVERKCDSPEHNEEAGR